MLPSFYWFLNVILIFISLIIKRVENLLIYSSFLLGKFKFLILLLFISFAYFPIEFTIFFF